MSSRLSREAGALLDAVRAAEDPTDEDEARVRRALAASVAAGVTCHWERYPLQGDAPHGDAAPGDTAGDAAGDALAPPAAQLGKAGTAVTKVGLVAWVAPLSVVALCAAAWWGARAGDRAEPHPPSPASSVAPAAAPDEPALLEPARPERTERPPVSSEAATADAGVPRAAGAGTAAAPPRPKVSARGGRAAQRPESSGLAAELALLRRAQAALQRGDGAGALRELDALADGGGQLLVERRVARVLALCSLGRIAEAQRLAAEVLRTEPGSVQRVALERSCANPSRNRQR